MAIERPEDMYVHAFQNNYALGAFNVYSMESAVAVMNAGEEQNAPVILQIGMGSHAYVKDLSAFVRMVKDYASKYKVPMFIQHDHCPTIQACAEAIEAGVDAVMFDGSHLTYEENIRDTITVVQMASNRGVWVEAELGCLPGFEDLVFSKQAVYTDPALVGDFIERTGCNALAIAVGTSHGGVSGDNYLPMDFERLHAIIHQNPNFPFVLHGAASLPPEMIAACNREGGDVPYVRNCSEETILRAVKLGIKKANMDVDNFLAFTTSARAFLNRNPELYDPRKYLSAGYEAFQKEVEHKLKAIVCSAGKAFIRS